MLDFPAMDIFTAFQFICDTMYIFIYHLLFYITFKRYSIVYSEIILLFFEIESILFYNYDIIAQILIKLIFFIT